MKKILIVCTTDSMIWNFLVPHIKEFEKRGYYIECASSITGSFFKELMDVYGVKMNEIPFERSPYNLKNFKAYIMLCRLIKEKEFDTIFCHEPVGGALGRLAGFHYGCKVIYMAHGFHFFKGAPKSRIIYYWVEKFLAHYTDTLITINQEDYEVSLNFKARKKVKLNGIGVDTRRFSIVDSDRLYLQERFNLPDNAITILSVGELIPRKNHEVIIKAIAQLNNPNIFYFIAGDGEIRYALEKLIDRYYLKNRVFLLGYRTDISQLCNSADIFAMPSVHEGLSVALMEAMGCGKAIVGSKIRGNVDLIDEGKGGYLCPTFNVDAYAEAIKKLIISSELRESFGVYNKNKVKNFDINRIREQLMDVLVSDNKFHR